MKKKRSFSEVIEAEVFRVAGDYVKEKVTRRLIKIGEVSVLIFMGFVLISFGLAQIMENYIPILDGGFGFMILGIVLFLLSATLRV